MTKTRFAGVLGSIVLGLMMLFISVPTCSNADPSHWWRQIAPSDFNQDTLSEVHLYVPDSTTAFVHLVDNEAETEDFDYTPNTGQFDQIWEQGGVGNPLWFGAYSQSFTPEINGVVDTVDMRLWRVGIPKDNDGNPATLTIAIMDAAQSGIYEPVLSTIMVQSTFTYNAVSTQQQLNSFRLTDTDSDNSAPLTSGHVYTLYVTSTAIQDQNNPPQTYYSWACSNGNPVQNTDGTNGCRKGLNNGVVQWMITGGGGQGTYDHPFIIFVHNFVHSGSLLSVVFDCGAVSSFTDICMGYTQGGTVTLHARTGSTPNPPTGWTDWIDEGTGSQNPGLTSNRYVQFDIYFVAGTDDLTTQGVRMVSIGYNTP